VDSIGECNPLSSKTGARSVADEAKTTDPFTESQKALMWGRWQKGDYLAQIAQLFDRYHSSIERILAEMGSIRLAPRCRSRLALTLADCEEIPALLQQAIRFAQSLCH
jgi:hypothetical protein